MISAQMIREQPDKVRRSLERRRAEAPLDDAIAVDRERRQVSGGVGGVARGSQHCWPSDWQGQGQ